MIRTKSIAGDIFEVDISKPYTLKRIRRLDIWKLRHDYCIYLNDEDGIQLKNDIKKLRQIKKFNKIFGDLINE